MSDDPYGIVHRAGCHAPTVIAAMPLAHALGRGPAIETIADGAGGELFRCRVCGALEGAGSGASVAADESERHGPEPITDSAEVERVRVELQDAGRPAGERSIAKALGVSRDAVRYALGKDRSTGH